ncbi:MAG: Ig-like domain-containing protein [Treponema sp.]|nr:Ig-like domain-containing protein [Treponema sp.]
MRFKNLVFLVILAVFAGNLFAAGGRDANVSRTAEDPSGFTDSIDISGMKPGKHNYYLEARDRAGNIALSGPENIFIDPESDLPRVTIISPMPFMRVQGNLNIVGIAFDDDAVAKVELTVNRGTDGRGEEIVRVTASGTDYWSYFLDTTDPEIWTDGNYTITAWATDINGLSGISDDFHVRQHKKHTVFWRLDRKKPETIVTSHEAGALVSGNIRLRGTVNDGNGINSFTYSLDGGNRYLVSRPNLDRRTGENTWEININTRQLEDGPNVIWFQARDGTGSIGTGAHLLFVNNTGPEVKIVYPQASDSVNGILSIAGYAQHPVGLRSVRWRAGNIASGEFELLPGNHWWSTEIDLRNQRISSIDIEIRAEDVSGNVTFARQRYRVDPARDLPVVTLIEPAAGVLSNPLGLVVRGNASDDDGVESIFYSLNGAEPVEIPCTGYFQFVIPTPAEGTHNLEVWAKDITGVIGNKVLVRGLVVPPSLLQPGIASITTGAARTLKTDSFYTGMTVRYVPIINPRTGATEGMERMTMQLAYRASVAPASASISFNEQTPVPVRLAGTRDIFTATVSVPDNLPDGINRIRLTATDRQGRQVIFDEYIFISRQTPEIVQSYNEEGELVQTMVTPSAQFTFEWVRANLHEDGRIIIGSNDEVLMGISSVPLTGVTVSGTGSGNVSAEIDGFGRVILRTLQEGEAGPLTLSLRSSDSTNQSAPFRILADFGPSITLQNVIEHTWVRTSVPVRFNVTGRTRISTVEYSLDMGSTWISFGAVASEYNRNIDITECLDGSVNILIRAASESGKSTITGLTVQKDTAAPEAELVMPIPEYRVNGTIRMAFAIKEMGALSTISYNRPARTGAPAITREIFNADSWEKDYSPRFIEVLMDSLEMPLDENMRFIFTDKAGNTSELASWQFIIDQEMDVPVVHIILPLEDEVITTDFVVSGVMYDDDGIKNIQWRIDNNPWQTLEAENAFYIPVLLSSLTDNEHTVTVIAEDIYGVRSQPVTRTFRVSLVEPAAAVTFPLVETVLKDAIELRGTAFDRNGIQMVEISVDNGNTFNNAKGSFGTAAETIQWTYDFNTRILKDGPHAVFIRVTDRYDVAATYATMINVDNTPPDVALDSPLDGSMTTGNIQLLGRILDPNLQEVSIQLRGLDGQQVSAALRSRNIDPATIIRESINLAGQADGHYNIAVIATDKAGNVTRISRNFELARQTFRNFIEILYPLENETVSGEFNMYGYAGGADEAGTVTIRVNGIDIITNEVDSTGYFRFNLNREHLNPGNNVIVVHSNFGGGTQVQSRTYNIDYMAYGPWVTIDSFTFGDFAYDRPYIFGRTGYILNEEDTALLADRNTDRVTRAEIQSKVIDFTEISFDNGRSFIKTSGRHGRDIDYRYRLETGDMPEGMHYIIIRSTMKNGETAISRMLVQVDKTPPVIRLISPEMGGRYNQEIIYSASATDDVELVSLTYHLRVGDKAMYAVPGFLQGLYIEASIPPFLRQAMPEIIPTVFAGGATYMDVGLGLSFFDDNVKIQAQYGFLTQDLYEALGGTGRMRYGGNVYGIKLLANIYSLPFISILGPDFEWLYATFALGANFSLFEITQSGVSTWLSALLLQVEFPRVSIPKRSNLRTFSLFTEGQLWFSPTDMSQNNTPTLMPSVIMGLRLYIF